VAEERRERKAVRELLNIVEGKSDPFPPKEDRLEREVGKLNWLDFRRYCKSRGVQAKITDNREDLMRKLRELD